MLYRKMGKAGLELSILGFGCMRLPTTADGGVDEPRAAQMLKYAVDHGVNYVDTAYPYHNGESELFLGRALEDGGYRDKVNLATKLPSWLIRSREDMDKYLNEQLKKLRTDHIDFYLVHGLMEPFWEKLHPMGIAEFLDDALADGRIRYAGFSFHGEMALFKEIIDAYDWTFCQIQYNFFDETYQAGTEGLHYAADKGLGVVIMEPLRGGMLSREIPAIKQIWDRAPVKLSSTEWALRWVWNHPEVGVVLSGMSSMEQMVQDVAYADRGFPNSLSQEELSLFERAREEYKERIKVPCTGCRYCMPCPSNVSVPECFEHYNTACMFDSPDVARVNYHIVLGGMLSGKTAFASQCEECGKCEELCPQGIKVREELKKVIQCFGK